MKLIPSLLHTTSIIQTFFQVFPIIKQIFVISSILKQYGTFFRNRNLLTQLVKHLILEGYFVALNSNHNKRVMK